MGNTLKFIGLLLTEKFSVNIFILALIIIIAGGATYYFSPSIDTIECPDCPDQDCPEADCPEEECVETVCPDCPEAPECPTCDECDENIYYMCTNGNIVNVTDDCEASLLPSNLNITSRYNDTYKDISLYINGVEYKTATSYKAITKIKYSIINNGADPIIPRVYVRLFSSINDPQKGTSHRDFEFDDFMMKGQWIQKEETVDIMFSDLNHTLALDLYDTTSDPDNGLITLEFPMTEAVEE